MTSDPEELGERLRNHATRTSAGTGLASGSLRRARTIQRRRTVVAAVAALAVLAGGIGGAGALGVFTSPSDGPPVAGPPVTTSAPPPSHHQTSRSSDPRTPPSDRETTSSEPDDTDPPPGSSDPTSPRTFDSPSNRPTGVDLCSLENAKVSMEAGPGSAGHVELFVVLTNASDAPCTVHGLPGVSIESKAGGQLGKDAGFDRSVDNPTITLAPGEAAKASVLLAQAGAYDEKDCRPEKGAGFRIYIPEEFDWVVVPWEVTGCANDEIELLSVRPFQPA